MYIYSNMGWKERILNVHHVSHPSIQYTPLQNTQGFARTFRGHKAKPPKALRTPTLALNGEENSESNLSFEWEEL